MLCTVMHYRTKLGEDERNSWCCSNKSMNLMHVFYEMSDVLLLKDDFFYTSTVEMFVWKDNVVTLVC